MLNCESLAIRQSGNQAIRQSGNQATPNSLHSVGDMVIALGFYAAWRNGASATVIFVGIASLLFCSGCDVSKTTPSIAETEINPSHCEIDVGVVFRDRSSYLCLPFSRFGLSSSEDIKRVETSCECVKASLVRFSESSTIAADGLLFEFISDEQSHETTLPQQLAIEVLLTMVNGETRPLTLSLLHSQLRPSDGR